MALVGGEGPAESVSELDRLAREVHEEVCATGRPFTIPLELWRYCYSVARTQLRLREVLR